MIDVIYLAAGQGKRTKLGYPKQFARLGGKPILVHGLEVLQEMEEVNGILVACPSEFESRITIKRIVDGYGISKARLLTGGVSRQESVKKALDWAITEYVLVAEAVRPFITADFVRGIIEAEGDFVVPWFSLKSTTVTIDGQCLNRNDVGEVQLPQKFGTNLLKKGHEETSLVNASDDTALIASALNRRPKLEQGLEENIKITTPLDLLLAQAIYQNKQHKGVDE